MQAIEYYKITYSYLFSSKTRLKCHSSINKTCDRESKERRTAKAGAFAVTYFIRTRSRDRTGTAFLPLVFETSASTNSAIRACSFACANIIYFLFPFLLRSRSSTFLNSVGWLSACRAIYPSLRGVPSGTW